MMMMNASNEQLARDVMTTQNEWLVSYERRREKLVKLMIIQI